MEGIRRVELHPYCNKSDATCGESSRQFASQVHRQIHGLRQRIVLLEVDSRRQSRFQKRRALGSIRQLTEGYVQFAQYERGGQYD